MTERGERVRVRVSRVCGMGERVCVWNLGLGTNGACVG